MAGERGHQGEGVDAAEVGLCLGELGGFRDGGDGGVEGVGEDREEELQDGDPDWPGLLEGGVGLLLREGDEVGGWEAH